MSQQSIHNPYHVFNDGTIKRLLGEYLPNNRTVATIEEAQAIVKQMQQEDVPGLIKCLDVARHAIDQAMVKAKQL